MFTCMLIENLYQIFNCQQSVTSEADRTPLEFRFQNEHLFFQVLRNLDQTGGNYHQNILFAEEQQNLVEFEHQNYYLQDQRKCVVLHFEIFVYSIFA